MKKVKKLESLENYSIQGQESKFTGGCQCATGAGTQSHLGKSFCFKSDTDTFDDTTGDWVHTTYHNSDWAIASGGGQTGQVEDVLNQSYDASREFAFANQDPIFEGATF